MVEITQPTTAHITRRFRMAVDDNIAAVAMLEIAMPTGLSAQVSPQRLPQS